MSCSCPPTLLFHLGDCPICPGQLRGEEPARSVEGPMLDAALGRTRAGEGMERAERAHAPTWASMMREALVLALERVGYGEELCADQVWAALGFVPEDSGAASALGGVMRWGVEGGLMERTGNYRKSERPAARRKPLPVYRSLVRDRALR